MHGQHSEKSKLNELNTELELLRAQNSKLIERVAQLERDALTDPLTGVANRRGFDRELEKSLAAQSRYGLSVCLMLVDLDRLKQINDQFGHDQGDKVLRTLASTLLESVRVTDHVSRIGGDEFAIILTAIKDEDISQVSERIQKSIQSLSEDGECSISVSVGAALADQDEPAMNLFHRVDELLYQNKSRFKNL